MADEKEEKGYLTEKGASQLLGDKGYDRLPVKVKPHGNTGVSISDTDGTKIGTGDASHYTPKLLESELAQSENAKIKWIKHKRGV